MPPAISPDKDVLDVVVQALLVGVPIAISWFIRTFVRSNKVEKDVATIMHLAKSAIDFAEDTDHRGDLVVPPGVRKGALKAKLATEWLTDELDRNGIKLTEEQAGGWIASEFQKQVQIGVIRPVKDIAELTRAAVDMVQNLDLEQTSRVQVPSRVDQGMYLTVLAADWLIVQLAQIGVEIARDEATTWVRAEILQRLRPDLPAPALISAAVVQPVLVDDRLSQLAEEAVRFVDQLKSSGQIALRAGGETGADLPGVEEDLVTAYLLTEAAKQGLAVTTDDIAREVTGALRRRMRST
jgi:hypothetical protein